MNKERARLLYLTHQPYYFHTNNSSSTSYYDITSVYLLYIIGSLVFGFDLFPEHVDVVEVLFVLVLVGHHCGGGDGGLGNLVLEDSPVKLWFLEVAHSLVGQTVADSDVHAGGGEHSVDFAQHLVCVGAGAISAEDGVEGSLVNYSIESSIFILEGAHVHLLEGQVGDLFLVHLLHLLDHGERDVYVGDVLVPILIHLFAQP